MKRRVVKGETYVLVVMRVHEWDALGRPSKVEIGYDDTSFDLSDEKVSRHFITAFVPEAMIKPQTKQ